MSNCEIRVPTTQEIFDWYGKSLMMKAVVVDGKVLAMGGLVARDGRIWAFGEVEGDLGQHALKIVRACREHLKAYPTIYAQRSAALPTAGKFLQAIGFEPTDEEHHGLKVYKWQN